MAKDNSIKQNQWKRVQIYFLIIAGVIGTIGGGILMLLELFGGCRGWMTIGYFGFFLGLYAWIVVSKMVLPPTQEATSPATPMPEKAMKKVNGENSQ